MTWLYTLFEQTFGKKNRFIVPTSSKRIRIRHGTGLEADWRNDT
jgi:hypothetical protein